MEALKLSILDEQLKKHQEKLKIKDIDIHHVGACECPCWAFIKRGRIVAWDDDGDDDIASTGSWNID